jgi:hypothetical protein
VYLNDFQSRTSSIEAKANGSPEKHKREQEIKISRKLNFIRQNKRNAVKSTSRDHNVKRNSVLAQSINEIRLELQNNRHNPRFSLQSIRIVKEMKDAATSYQE